MDNRCNGYLPPFDSTKVYGEHITPNEKISLSRKNEINEGQTSSESLTSLSPYMNVFCL